MRKLIFLALMFLSFSAFAINWEPVYLHGNICTYIDEDSIQKTDKYYFYNITFKTQEGDNLVITLQSSLSSPFSARIKIYSSEDYANLKGDYEHIKDNQTDNLEPVTYGSVVSAVYNYVKTIDTVKNNTSIIIK